MPRPEAPVAPRLPVKPIPVGAPRAQALPVVEGRFANFVRNSDRHQLAPTQPGMIPTIPGIPKPGSPSAPPRLRGEAVTWKNPGEEIPPVLFGQIEFGQKLNVERRKLGTAYHELRHAYIGAKLGGSLVSLSVNADQTSWGRTILTGLSPREFQITAMASSINSPMGVHGTGGDEYQTEMIQHFHGGMDKGSASAAAHGMFDIDPLVENRTAEIIAFRGQVSGKEFFQILEFAALEAAFLRNQPVEKAFADLLVYTQTGQKASEPYEGFVLPPDRMEIIDNRNGTNTMDVYKNGEKTESVVVCGLCYQPGGIHLPECPTRQERKKEETLVKKSEKIDTIPSLPGRRGRTFSPEQQPKPAAQPGAGQELDNPSQTFQ